MKKIAYLLSILILFQSCYSYKTFDIKEYETIKPKKVEIELNNSRKHSGKIIAYKNDKILIKDSNQIIEINTSEIKNIQKKKFSPIKTIIATSIGIIAITKLLEIFENLFKSGLKGAFKDFKFPA